MTAPGAGRRALVVTTVAALVVVLLVPVGVRLRAAVVGLGFLVEFLTEGQYPWLSRLTGLPTVERVGGPGGAPSSGLDLYRPAGRLGPWPGLVLVHGLTPDGKSDARLAWTADRLARAGFVVAVPELPALKAQRLRPEDATVVRDALARLAAHPAVQRHPVTVISVSVGLGPVALALAEPGLAGQVRLVLALGGYADARELVRYFTTGAYAFGGVGGRVPVDPALARAFIARNLDLVADARDRSAVAGAVLGAAPPVEAGPGAQAVLAILQNSDPARVDGLLEALPAETRALLDALSPARHLGRTGVRLLLVHGKDDPAIPFTERLRLAAAAPARTRLVLVELVGHVEGQAPAWHRLADLLRLWSVSYELLAG